MEPPTTRDRSLPFRGFTSAIRHFPYHLMHIIFSTKIVIPVREVSYNCFAGLLTQECPAHQSPFCYGLGESCNDWSNTTPFWEAAGFGTPCENVLKEFANSPSSGHMLPCLLRLHFPLEKTSELLHGAESADTAFSAQQRGSAQPLAASTGARYTSQHAQHSHYVRYGVGIG